MVNASNRETTPIHIFEHSVKPDIRGYPTKPFDKRYPWNVASVEACFHGLPLTEVKKKKLFLLFYFFYFFLLLITSKTPSQTS